MWHEVRKQERKIRCMIVDYKRRAERRKDYYEKIKADPTQFLQIHGRPYKIHLDPAIALAGDSPLNMMPWQGNPEVVIDRFDVRAHLDHIPETPKEPEAKLLYEDRHINYERYRILVQNDFLGVSEEKFLHQLHLDEQYGAVSRSDVPNEGKKKVQGAAIGFNYDDPSAPPAASQNEDEEEEEEDSDIDFDVCVDVNKVSNTQANELNSSAQSYGLEGNDFFSFLTKDREEADNLKLAKELEEEKAMYSGRKSRRERRAYREKKLAGRVISPPSYASRKSPTYRDYRDSKSNSRSRSPSPVNSGKITYITSFGEDESTSQAISPKPRTTSIHRVRSPSPRNYVRKRSRSRSRSRKYGRQSSRTKSKWGHSSWRSRSRSRSISRSRSPPRHYTKHRRSRSSTSSSSSRSSSRSMSSERSPTRHYPVNRSISRSPKSKSRRSVEPLVKQPPAPIISRYYGRRGASSSSELSVSDDETTHKKDSSNQFEKKSVPVFGNSSSRNKAASSSSGPRITPQERLKRKMQALLNKQYKADKRAEREKQEKVEQERIDREDEMREISIKLRKRERMRRHEYMADYDRHKSSSSSRSRSRSRSRSFSPRRLERRRRSRSGSTSPRSYKSGSRTPSPDSYKSSRPLVDY